MKELKIQPIKNGSVIDHIPPGKALKVLRILSLPKKDTTSIISAVMNVPSETVGKKDIVKIEDKELDPDESDKVALIAPHATVNIIRDYEVIEKHALSIPNELVNIVKCPNPSCISNSNEPISPRFKVISKRPPIKLRCYYCEREPADIEAQII
ncbi:MAG TPA: aspartate carbamoyltransferase regulatory subunit [Thermoplasmata archaeon]|nr:aspartate carbamoyltransferase regulatory subunit [Thermoplasmata archaeon]